MANFSVVESTLEMIRQFEGLSLKAYWDVSRYSIGYGSGTLANGAKVKSTDVITKAQAEQLLTRDAKEAAGYVNRYVTSAINRNMFDALTSFVYNVGVGNFLGSNLLRLVNANPYDFDRIGSAFREDQWTTYGRGTRRQIESYAYAQPGVSPDIAGFPWLLLIVLALLFFNRKNRRGRR